MLNLYFNCKITKAPLFNKLGNSKVYEIPKFEILKKTLESFRVLKFKISIFNIEIDAEDNSMQNKELKLIIEKNIKSKKIILNFTRPSTIQQWQKDVKIAQNLINKNEPVLVCMNHDHPYIDYSTKCFYNCVEKIFPEYENNFQKVFFYSHGPEVISSIHNNQEFQKNKFGIFKKRKKLNKFIDSICVMSLETLFHIWKCKVFNGNYIGRFDWPETGFTSDLNLISFAYPREFFKHFDGYSHVTTLKNITKINFQSSLPIEYPKKKDNKALVKFYYQRWENVFLLSIRDTVKKKFKNQLNNKEYFLKEVRKSIALMDQGYFFNDFNERLINNFQYSDLKKKLYEYIKHKSNSLIYQISKDIKISNIQPSVKQRIIFFILSYFPSWVSFEIKNYKKKFFNYF
jgi:hypothetical protein